MAQLLDYTLRYFRWHWLRTSTTLAGLTISFAALLSVYGIASWAEVEASRALTYLTGDADLWIIPPNGISLNNANAIISMGAVSDDVIRKVLSVDKNASVERVTARGARLQGKPIVFYSREKLAGKSLAASKALWELLGSQRIEITLCDMKLKVLSVDPDLPSLSLSGSFAQWKTLCNPTGQANMLLVHAAHPLPLATSISESTGAVLTDAPDHLANQSAANAPTILLLKNSLSRFDPYAFSTKYSSVQVQVAMCSIIGWSGRIIFMTGVVLSITSFLIGITERWTEAGVFVLLGLRSEFTILLLSESALFILGSFVLGISTSTTLLWWLLPAGELSEAIGPSLGICCLYAFILFLIAPLVAAQKVANASAAKVFRSSDQP